jgi:tetratricopeptide (TPR) repeat protein
MSNNIQNLYVDFRSNFDNTPENCIDYFERNSIYFNNQRSFEKADDLKLYVEIVCKYALALNHKGNYNVCIAVVEANQHLIETEIQKFTEQDIKDEWYYRLKFAKGMAYYNLNDFKNAKPIFENLVQYDVHNDNYRRWLVYTKYGLNLWIVSAANIISIVLILLEMAFHSQLNPMVASIMVTIGVFCLLFNWTFDYYIKRSFRKKSSQFEAKK